MNGVVDTTALYERLPHAGSMCLVDEIIDWDHERIQCATTSHLTANNPLRVAGRLPAICVLEYAAQAFALHGMLVADESGTAQPDAERVFVALVPTLELSAEYLDGRDGALQIDGHIIFRQAGSAVYRFEAFDATGPVAGGQIGLMS